MACKFNRERKDDGVKKRKEYMAPTYAVFEDQPPVKKTTMSYTSDEEDYGSFAPQEETKSDYRNLASAKPLTEFEKMSWIPVEFGDTLKCAGPLPTEDLVEEEELFPPEVPLRKNDDNQDTGEVLQKLFQKEELDSDFVSEVKLVIGVKPESSLIDYQPRNHQLEFRAPSTKKSPTTYTAQWKPREALNLVLEEEDEGFFSEEATNATNELEQNIEETRDLPVEPLGDLNHHETLDVELEPLPDGLRY
ncbi:hypothetical protein U9M48_040545 [Paspalum notatum var. saurae]|uniref:Uncharacterized protein n=1 Tax=Paspalum notatum var. saurae TaxID=547442 RepID=A0AAQ3UM14_PASNO